MKRIQTVLVTATLLTLATSLLGSILPTHAQDPDFSITGTPSGQCILLGESASYTFTVSSLAGFQGNVQLEDSIDPNVNNGPTLSSIPSNVNVAQGQSAAFDLTASTTQSTPNQVYAITVYGLSGAIVHSATVYLAFQPLCGAAGGAIQPVSVIGVMAPYFAIAVSMVGLTATASLLYLRRRKTE